MGSAATAVYSLARMSASRRAMAASFGGKLPVGHVDQLVDVLIGGDHHAATTTGTAICSVWRRATMQEECSVAPPDGGDDARISKSRLEGHLQQGGGRLEVHRSDVEDDRLEFEVDGLV
ncbi:hypothetical protein TYRP_022486 [Tyrophagus putrescentiae]|nr:hypothetical protein TYRP_022486 [Tyrophagus putrescentiae]